MESSQDPSSMSLFQLKSALLFITRQSEASRDLAIRFAQEALAEDNELPVGDVVTLEHLRQASQRSLQLAATASAPQHTEAPGAESQPAPGPEGEADENAEATNDASLLAAINGHQFEQCQTALSKNAVCINCEESLTTDDSTACKCLLCSILCHYKCIPYVSKCRASSQTHRRKSRMIGHREVDDLAEGNGSEHVTGFKADPVAGAVASTPLRPRPLVRIDNMDDSDRETDDNDERAADDDEDDDDEEDDDENWDVSNSSSDDEEEGEMEKSHVSHGTSFTLDEPENKRNSLGVDLAPSPFYKRRSARSARRFGRSNATEAEWERQTKSFRARLTASKKLDFKKLFEALQNTQHLHHEFEQIPENRPAIESMPRLTEDLNRYFNILPNNHTRVLLPRIGDDERTEYINANFISGYGPRAMDRYIATQGPLPHTILAFWRMVWESKTHVIVMSTDLVENNAVKCERYWPQDVGTSVVYGDYVIRLQTETNTCPQFVTSKLLISCGDDDIREITHLWWRAWPDQGVPETADGIFPFINTARDVADEEGGPIVVHCSAGVGRTGCFINIDIGMQQWDELGVVDILSNVCKTRRQRGLSVQTPVQYVYIHFVLLEYMRQNPREDQPYSMQGTVPPESSPRSSGNRNRSSSSRRRTKQGNMLTAETGNAPTVSSALSTASVTVKPASPHSSPRLRRSVYFQAKTQAADDRPGSTEPSEVDLGEHDFVTKTYVRETKCDECNEVLTGLARQGLRCKRCQINIHHYCLKNVDPDCRLSRARKSRQSHRLPVWPPRAPIDYDEDQTA